MAPSRLPYQFEAIVLAQLAHLLMILSAAHSEEEKAALIEQMESHLAKGLSAAETVVATKEERSAHNDFTDSSIAIRQLKMALEEKNYKDLENAFDLWLESLNISPDALEKEIAQLRGQFRSFRKIRSQESSDQPITGIINVV